MDTEILCIYLKLSCPFYCQDPVDLGWEPYVKSWLWKTSKIMHKSGVDCLEFMIKNSVTDGLQFIKKHQKFQPFPVQDITVVTTLCRILDAFFEFMSQNGVLEQCEFFLLSHIISWLVNVNYLSPSTRFYKRNRGKPGMFILFEPTADIHMEQTKNYLERSIAVN